MRTDARTYENSADFDGGWLDTVAKVFKSPGQWYLKVAIDFTQRSEPPAEKTAYDPVENTLTMRGHASSTSAYDAGKTQGVASTLLALTPALYAGGMVAFVGSTPAAAVFLSLIALLLVGVSLGSIYTILNWTVIDERVERPETADVIEQYVGGEIDNEDELERQLEASLE